MSGPDAEAHRSKTPPELTHLLSVADQARDGAWARFLDTYSSPILRTVYTRCTDYDNAMDRYAYILEQLQEDDYRRLRQYAADGRAQFTTWLAVVTRRLCEDYRRQRYGRPQSQDLDGGREAAEQFKIRRLLADLVGSDPDWSQLPSGKANPEHQLRQSALYDALFEALQELDVADQLLIRLRFEYDLPAKRIAHLMGFPTPFHVYRRLRSRLGFVRRKLRERGFSDSAP